MSTQSLSPNPTAIIAVSDEQIHTIEAGRDRLLERAESLIINGPDAETIGWAIVNGIADLRTAITDDFEPARIATHAAWKAVVAQRDSHLSKLADPDKIVRGKLATWDAEKRHIAEEAARQERIERAAEQRRLQAIADANAKAEQERRRAEAEERRIQEAIEAERAGLAEVAAAILEKPIEVVPVVAAAVMMAPSVVPNFSTQKVEGSGSMVDNWTYVITNPELIPREYLVINESAIAKVVKALKKVAEKTIPGIEVKNIPQPRTSGKRG